MSLLAALKKNPVILVAALLAVQWGISHAGAADGNALPPAVADHHLHIQGPDITDELQKMAKKSPDLFKEMDPGLLKIHTGADALRELDEAGIKQGVLLSQAYTFASPLVKDDKLDVPTLTRRENQYVVNAALASGGRLLAFVSADPLDGGAIEELRYWAGKPGVSGVKLHLANSGVDLQSKTEMATLAKFIDAVREARLPLVIHVRGSETYGAAEAQRFVDEILPHVGETPVQIAHAAGWGGLDEPTLQALSVFANAIEHHAPGTQNLVFDLAVVVLNDHTDPALARRLAELMRRIGLRRFVVGSDWPAVFPPRKHNALLESQVPLTPAEWRVVLGNRAMYIR